MKPAQIQGAIGVSNTTLYTAFVNSGVSFARLVTLDLENTTNADITVDVFWENAGASTTRKFADDLPVPAKGNAVWRGLIPLLTGEKIRAIASATGVDVLGAVEEG